ncbi:U3 small nucleolar RNA-associated protein 6-domain-containing protein [Blastocladiella britannica]|nr:U3 small nucleolar RNA-associated protein 6-domain-containing protein [Blastocladiella britannica]
MADGVHIALEGMVPELKDARRKQLFTAIEVKSIVKRRTAFEYALKRRGAILSDFLQYIDYEWQLEKLRRKRVGRMGQNYKYSICDYAGVKRLHNLFNRAVQKFPGNVDLWLQYVAMAKKHRSYKRLGSIFARAIQLHPRHSGLWILAAAWEFETQANAGSARKLFQRAVHMNRESVELWTEWFKMEAMYVTKVRVRAELTHQAAADAKAKLLGHEVNAEDQMDDAVAAESSHDLDDVDMDNDEEEADEETMTVANALSRQPMLSTADVSSASALDQSLAKADAAITALPADILGDALIQYAIPQLVYDAAIAAHPTNLSLRIACLRIAVSSHGAESLINHIVASIATDLAATSADALIVALAWKVHSAVAATAPSSPEYPMQLHLALTAIDAAHADARYTAIEAAVRDATLQFLDTQLQYAGRTHADVHEYIAAQIQRQVVAYLALAPEFSAALAEDAADFPRAPHPSPLLASTWERIVDAVPQLPAAPAGVTLRSVTAAATAHFPTHVPLILARMQVDPAWAATAVTSVTRAIDLCDVYLGVHQLAHADRSVSVVPSATAADMIAQWRRVSRGSVDARDTDRAVERKAAFLASALQCIPVAAERVALRDWFMANVPVVDVQWFAALLSGDSGKDRSAPTTIASKRRILQLGAQRWPANVDWWLRWLAFEIGDVDDVAAATQLYMRAVRAVNPDDAEDLTAGWNKLKDAERQ